MEADLRLISFEIDDRDDDDIPSGPKWRAKYAAKVDGIGTVLLDFTIDAKDVKGPRGEYIPPTLALRFAERRAAEFFIRVAETAKERIREGSPT